MMNGKFRLFKATTKKYNRILDRTKSRIVLFLEGQSIGAEPGFIAVGLIKAVTAPILLKPSSWS